MEIISVDSRQIYHYMDIGTAKPTREQMDQCPHHFIDILKPDQRYSAGEYARAARSIINEIWNKGGTPLLVGGTGLYWQSVYDGFFGDNVEYQEVRKKLQDRLEDEGLAPLYEELGRLDPITHARLAAGDVQRILRGLEVVLGGSKPLSDQWNNQEDTSLGGRSYMIGLTMRREKLYERIEKRVDLMIEQGLVAEVKNLLDMDYDRNTFALGTLGYLEIIDYLAGKSSLDEACNLIKQRTRNFAKRQITWCRRDRRLRELDIEVWGYKGVVNRIVEGWRYGQKGLGLC